MQVMAGKKLSVTPFVDPSASLKEARLGAYTEVGARTKLLEVDLGDYSYVVNDSDIAYATIGNGGTLYQPQVVRAIETSDGVVQEFPPRVRRQVSVRPESFQRVVQGEQVHVFHQ